MHERREQTRSTQCAQKTRSQQYNGTTCDAGGTRGGARSFKAAGQQEDRRQSQVGQTAKGRGGGGGGGAVSTGYAEGPGRLWRTNNGGVCVRGEGLGVVHTCTFPIPPADYAHPKEGGGKEREDDLQKCLSVSMTMEYMGWGGAALHYSITGWSLGSPGRGRVAGTALQSWR